MPVDPNLPIEELRKLATAKLEEEKVIEKKDNIARERAILTRIIDDKPVQPDDMEFIKARLISTRQ